MTIKITTPNSGGDSLDFGSATTTIAAQVVGNEVSSGEGKLEVKTTTGGASATKVTIAADGNVGIGTASPTHKLSVEGTTDNVNSQIKATASGVASGGFGLNSTGMHFGCDLGNGIFSFRTATTGGGSFTNTGTERMRITGTGTLEAQSPASTTGLQPFTIDWKNENNAGIMASIGCDRTASSAAPADLVFRTSTSVDSGAISEKFRITSDGRGLSQFTAKAWINFNGASTVAIIDSHNITSITDNGTGDYTVTIAVDMGSATYAVTAGSRQESANLGGTGYPVGGQSGLLVGSFRMFYYNSATDGHARDQELVMNVVFGD